MSRISLKTVSSALVEFIPKSHLDNSDLSLTAKEIKDRPMVFKVRKLTREDRFNIRSLTEYETRDVEGENSGVATNVGTILKYIWDNCVIEVHNVLYEDKALDVVKGDLKNELFNTEGIDTEILEVVRYVQELSALTGDEAKN